MASFTSLDVALRRTADTVARFPFTVLSALVATVTTMNATGGGGANDWSPRLLATAVLGLALFTGITTAAERFNAPRSRRFLVELVAVAGLGALYVASRDWTDRSAIIRFAQLGLVVHLFVAIAPYLHHERRNGFWQYNRFLFLRFLVATFYALVLWLGLTLALAALKPLFEIHVSGEVYADLWTLLGFGFQPLFFLGGVPRDFEALDTLDEYPTGLKVFSQFVLIPLVTVYLAILTLYLGRVVTTGTWPSGWIGYLVSAVATTGVLALLLVHPVRERSDSTWVNAYGRWFFVAILPSLAMLLLAVGKRMAQYGITEPRYFLLLLALWLTVLAVYYAVTASRSIKIIPESLCAVVLLAAIGPWGAYGMSERSQARRFREIVARNDLGTPEGLVMPKAPVSETDRIELAGIVRYFVDTRGIAAAARMAGVPADSAEVWQAEEISDPDRRVLVRMGLQYAGTTLVRAEEGRFWINERLPTSADIAGYQTLIPVNWPGGGPVIVGSDTLTFSNDRPFEGVTISRNGAALATLTFGPVLDSLLRDASGSTIVLDRPLGVDAVPVDSSVAARLIITSGHGEKARRSGTFDGVNGYLLLRGIGRPR
ncbi:MAG: DUF4153 domain-containing protein [Gemmatimonadales bacterium]|nr:DUF4153 domain-containing protein [Gemmatimonadales bacterium]